MALVQKASKKRSAAFQAGRKSKKVHTEKASIPEKQRSRPVTLPTTDDDYSSGSDSEEKADDGEEEERGGDRDDDERDGAVGDQDVPMNSKPVNAAQKDPNAARESHKAQKLLLEQRRASRPHSSLLTEAKRVWSLARQKIPSAERRKHVQDLMDIIRGKVKEVVFKHDASRIVQTVVKYGGQAAREEIAAELKGNYKDLTRNKYSKFLITKLIRLCPAQRAGILLEFQGSVLRMLLHRESTSVLADAFELHASAYERTILLRDFYGKEAALFGVTIGSAEDKERAKKGLKGILEGADTERRRRTLTSVKENVVTVFNNPEKGAVTHAIVHRIVWEYLQALNDISDEVERDKLRRELFDSCQEVLAEMVHTRDGSRVVREFLARSSAKDRKQILKVLKPHIQRMCVNDEAQLVLFTALDVIDDTKLLSKSLIAEMTAPATLLYISPQGRRSLLYLLVPRTRRHYTPAQIAIISETDEIRSQTSKKDAQARADEIRKSASGPLLSWVEETCAKLVRDPGGCLLVAEIMLFADSGSDKTAATQALLRAISAPYPSLSATEPHPIDLPHTSRLYKTLLQGGHYNHTTKSIEYAPSWDSVEFALACTRIVGKDVLVAMCAEGKGNGAFMMAELCEALLRSEGPSIEEARELVKGWFDSAVVQKIESGNAKGKKIILQKLAAL